MISIFEPLSLNIVGGMLPFWLKILYTLFVCLIVPVYWVRYGPANFLWFSDIALFGAGLALWLESPLIASTMAVAVLFFEIVWNLDYLIRLLTGKELIGLSGYMFNSKLSLFLRGLSLFHVVLPVLLVWLVYRLGYHPKAWLAQTILAWVILPICYFFTKPADNINWVFGIGQDAGKTPKGPLYLLLLMVGFPLVVYGPTHLLLKKLFSAS